MTNISVWARAVRVRFLLASVIGVTTGLTISWSGGMFDPFYAIITYFGVISLHASVDLLNDYFDYKSGIDLITIKTPFSGGTGVLPDETLNPSQVYLVGMIFLIIGVGVGIYLAFVRGLFIIPLVGLAALSTYFYSTRLANYGLGELFVAIKGMLIVVGTYYVQTISITLSSLYTGAVLGLLSASVLFMNEFPDYDADKEKNRKNLVVRLGRERSKKIFIIFPLLIYSLIAIGVSISILHLLSLASFLTIPLYVRSYRGLSIFFKDANGLVPTMANNVLTSRIIGLVIAISFLFPTIV